MYASALFYIIGAPLLLGSWIGLAVVPLMLIGMAPRAVREENLLRQELPGYADYMNCVRWRLIPHVW